MQPLSRIIIWKGHRVYLFLLLVFVFFSQNFAGITGITEPGLRVVLTLEHTEALLSTESVLENNPHLYVIKYRQTWNHEDAWLISFLFS